MENASKALIIAGEILIGILILSLISYIVMQFGNFSKNVNSQISETETIRFNANFSIYENRANISIQDIATVINLTKHTNDEYEATYGDDYYIDVCIDGISVLNENISVMLEHNRNNTYYYCNLSKPTIIKSGNDLEIRANITNTDITYNENTGRVNKINFHPITDIDYVTALLYGNKIVWKIQ